MLRKRYLLLALLFAALIAGRLDAQAPPQPVFAANAASFERGLTTGVNAIFRPWPTPAPPFSDAAAVAQSLPLPTELVGVNVLIAGESAPLFFVSPSQINLVVADRFAGRRVTLDVLRDGHLIYRSEFNVSPAFGVFTANAQGFGSPAALLLITSLNRYDQVADGNAQPLPLQVSAAGEPNFLILFVTGLNSRRPIAVIDGLEYPVAFAGPAPGLAGVEQVNVRLGDGFADKGLVSLRLKAGNQWSNLTWVYFQ